MNCSKESCEEKVEYTFLCCNTSYCKKCMVDNYICSLCKSVCCEDCIIGENTKYGFHCHNCGDYVCQNHEITEHQC